jgi:hypothetical protein
MLPRSKSEMNSMQIHEILTILISWQEKMEVITAGPDIRMQSSDFGTVSRTFISQHVSFWMLLTTFPPLPIMLPTLSFEHNNLNVRCSTGTAAWPWIGASGNMRKGTMFGLRSEIWKGPLAWNEPLKGIWKSDCTPVGWPSDRLSKEWWWSRKMSTSSCVTFLGWMRKENFSYNIQTFPYGVNLSSDLHEWYINEHQEQ